MDSKRPPSAQIMHAAFNFNHTDFKGGQNGSVTGHDENAFLTPSSWCSEGTLANRSSRREKALISGCPFAEAVKFDLRYFGCLQTALQLKRGRLRFPSRS